MPAFTTIYSVKPLDGERWAVEKKGALRRSAVMDSKKDALRRARELAAAERGGGGALIKVFDASGRLEDQLELAAGGRNRRESP